MSERDFNMVSPNIWKSERFNNLPQPAKLLHIYLLSGPHQTSAGGYRLPAAYAAEDIGCTVDEFTANMKIVTADGLAIYDDTTKEVFVPGWFRHCPPANLKHAKGVSKVIARMTSEAVRQVMETEFACTEWGGKLSVDNSPEAHPFDTPNSGNRLLGTNFMRGGNGR